MTDTTEYGLGAIESPPDPRDYPIADLYAALGLEAVALPARYRHAPMPTVLNQHTTPQCVAFSAAAEQMAFDIRDQKSWFTFDEARFFTMIGGGPGGADVRVALGVRKATGYPTVGHDDAGSHRIAAYYAVPRDVLSIKQAIFTFGPLILATPWANSWFHPVNGVLPAPSGGIAGGHAIVAYGWDDAGLLLRNSWGAAWGVAGDAFLPYSQIGTTWSWWRAVDVIELTRWTMNVAANAVVLVATITAGGCISGWTSRKWGPAASSAPASAPVTRPGCSSGSAQTTRVTAGAFAGLDLRVGNGVALTLS
jgi:hypothetical protein